ncbi:MAG: ABC transporter permease [Peptostreptococcaceae bacterium]|nr:ABC transporter permease [Peptostreptococcaceae bacterium]
MRSLCDRAVTDLLKKGMLFFSSLLMISVLTFLLIKLSPGDPAANYLRASRVAITEETLAKARVELGLDKPVIKQYADWLSGVLKGDLGRSYLKKAPVLQVISGAIVPTLQLGAVSFVALLILTLCLGISSALLHDRWWDHLVQGFCFACASVPTFWLGYMLIIFFAVLLQWVPVSGRGGMANFFLPCLTLITPLVGQTSLLIRKSLMEQMQRPHVHNAVLRGVNKRYIITNHLLKNSLIPIITVLSSNILYLITGSVLIEEVFAWPGVGKMFVSAVKGGDIPVIQGSLLLFGVLAIAVNALTQRAVRFLDPHLRIGGREVVGEKE